MNTQMLSETVKLLFADNKGLLAMDESTGTCNKRFEKVGIPQTVEARRAYRELIVTAPRLGESIGGAILFDETIHQQTTGGTPFVKVLQDAGIIPGIKVDEGAKELALHPGEKVTEGLDGLRDRLATYSKLGARFAKWRAVITIGDGIPSWGCMEANAHALARYAALCQEQDLVPIVEPEVLMDGDHTMEQCQQVTDKVLRTVFSELFSQRVVPEGMVLKPNMVLAGGDCAVQPGCGRGGRRHRELLPASRSRRCSGDCVSVGRPIGRAGFSAFECDECAIQIANAVGIELFIFARHPAARFGDVEGAASQRCRGTESPGFSRTLQSGCARRRIFRGDGEDRLIETNWPDASKSAVLEIEGSTRYLASNLRIDFSSARCFGVDAGIGQFHFPQRIKNDLGDN